MHNNRVHKFMHDICRLSFILGAPNVWYAELDLPDRIKKFVKIFQRLLTVYFAVMLTSQLIGVFTQTGLTMKQNMDRALFVFFTYPVFISSYISFYCYKKKITQLVKKIVYELKIVYNDPNVEEENIAMLRFYSRLYSVISYLTVLSYGLTALINCICYGSTFMVVVTAWPSPSDYSFPAILANVVNYITFGSSLMWYTGCVLLCQQLTICNAFHFRQIRSYFMSLTNIFTEDLEHLEKEKKYEKMFALGIKQHQSLLECTKLAEEVFMPTYFGAVFLYVGCVAMLLFQITQDNSFTDLITIINTGAACILCTGITLCKAGDITHEAELLPDAVFMSGWEHCRGSASPRIRRLVVITMAQAQSPVVMRALFVVEMSYATFLRVVKGAYTIFSVFR